jgi:peptidoglycan L-alanyl-D-glutamate endopeptidase CwlK
MSRLLVDLVPEMQPMWQRVYARVRDELRYTLVLIHTYRSLEEQAWIYAQGRTRPGSIVTNAKPGYSWHNFRRALDYGIRVNNIISWKEPFNGFWEKVWEIAHEEGFTDWGGSYGDYGHLEYHPNITLAMVRSENHIPEVENA